MSDEKVTLKVEITMPREKFDQLWEQSRVLAQMILQLDVEPTENVKIDYELVKERDIALWPSLISNISTGHLMSLDDQILKDAGLK